MKRTLLLIPALVLFLIACREKHVTTTAKPPAPDPNAYSTAPPVTTTENEAAEVVVTVDDGNTSGSNTTTNDTVVTNVSMPTEVTIPTAEDSSKLSRLVVSFISKGEGTDGAAKANLDKWLSKHADVKYTVVTWGREGEVDYIFNLRDRAAASQNQVVQDVRTLIGTNDLVLIQEWVEGHKARNTGIVDPLPADTSATRLVVSFISKGEGIDHKTKEEFEVWLGMRGNVTWETSSWGREGEVNFCFRLSNMQTREQDIFVRDVRTFFTDKELVLVSEWAPCDRRK